MVFQRKSRKNINYNLKYGWAEPNPDAIMEELNSWGMAFYAVSINTFPIIYLFSSFLNKFIDFI